MYLFSQKFVTNSGPCLPGFTFLVNQPAMVRVSRTIKVMRDVVRVPRTTAFNYSVMVR